MLGALLHEYTKNQGMVHLMVYELSLKKQNKTKKLAGPKWLEHEQLGTGQHDKEGGDSMTQAQQDRLLTSSSTHRPGTQIRPGGRPRLGTRYLPQACAGGAVR